MDKVENENTYSKLEWFLYIILLPCLFTLILIGIILSFLKVDVITPLLEAGNKIPYVEKIIPDPKVKASNDLEVFGQTFNPQEEEDKESDPLKEQINKYQLVIDEKERKISELEQELKTLEDQLTKSEVELKKLLANQKEASDEKRKKLTKEITELYSTMTPSKAAPILSNLSNHEAVSILAEMDNKKRSQILAKMDSKKAADLTVLLKEDTSSDDVEIKALQEKVDQLGKELDVAKATKKEQEEIMNDTIQSFELMEKAAAASILEKMWNDGSKSQVTDILMKLSIQSRSDILAKIKSETAATITSTLAK